MSLPQKRIFSGLLDKSNLNQVAGENHLVRLESDELCTVLRFSNEVFKEKGVENNNAFHLVLQLPASAFISANQVPLILQQID